MPNIAIYCKTPMRSSNGQNSREVHAMEGFASEDLFVSLFLFVPDFDMIGVLALGEPQTYIYRRYIFCACLVFRPSNDF